VFKLLDMVEKGENKREKGHMANLLFILALNEIIPDMSFEKTN